MFQAVGGEVWNVGEICCKFFYQGIFQENRHCLLYLSIEIGIYGRNLKKAHLGIRSVLIILNIVELIKKQQCQICIVLFIVTIKELNKYLFT